MKIENSQIMLVDDEPHNLDVLTQMLESEGCTVWAFPNGPMALASAWKRPPDLILLDVRMPDMDGYEVCRQLKKHPETKDVPVLFLSALTETAGKLKGFEVGGVDYITKPLQEREVLERVRTHLELQMHRRKLEQLLSQRSNQLFEAHRRLRILDNAKNDWLNVLAHEMRTPLTGIFGVAELVFSELPEDSEMLSMLPDYQHSRERIEKLIDDASLLVQLDTEDETRFHEGCLISDIFRSAVDIVKDKYEKSNIPVSKIETGLHTRGDGKLLLRCFVDLLETSLMCVESDENVALSLVANGDEALISIATNGGQLTQDALVSFFEVGGQTELLKAGGDFGLRPALARAILQIMQGDVRVENSSEKGIMIEVRLPIMNEVED